MPTPKPPRDAFRDAVFARDGHACVVCEARAADAHHIIDRTLFADGGYHVDNGASLCAGHHMEAETTRLSVEDVRKAAGISRPVVPPQFEPGQRYDKWGNPILPNGQRMPGEMFGEPGMMKALAAGGALALFTDRCKYPRTPHAPTSPGGTNDDMRLADMGHFAGRRVIGTVKMDGENSTLYRDGSHARSIDGRTHPSRDWLKAFHAGFAEDIPERWRVVVENMFAVHSIRYDALASYAVGLSVWDDRNVCLAWDDTVEWFHLLGIEPAEVVYDGTFDEAAMRRLSMPPGAEGTVWRLADAFPYAAFRRSVAKVVRMGHVQTDQHWMHAPVVRNGLRAESGRGTP